MCKFYSFLEVIFLLCFITLVHQGPLRAQEASVYGDNFDAPMIWNSPQFTYSGYFEGYANFYISNTPSIDNLDGNISYPSGNLYSGENPTPIPSGFYVLTINTETAEYVFEQANTCFDQSTLSFLNIFGYFETICGSSDLMATIHLGGFAYSGNFEALDFQWFRDGVPIPGATDMTLENINPSILNTEVYTVSATCPIDNNTLVSDEWLFDAPTLSWEITDVSQPAFCEPIDLNSELYMDGFNTGYFPENFEFQWLRNGTPIPGATNADLPNVAPSSSEESAFTLLATCPFNGETLVSNEVTLPACYDDSSSPLNYLLIQNVTTTGNIPGQSIQVQFDLNWGNTWKDDVNWDAAWVFMKYKDVNGVWQHAKVSPTGFDHGEGTPSLIEPAADQMGAFVRLAIEGQGNFSADGMQLRWNYGADGLASVSGLEVRVFAIEMVYHPQGDFSMSFYAAAPGNKTPVINSRLTPVLSADDDASIRIKGNAGLDVDANGSVDNTSYPTGYYPFYLFKYEMSDQQYADFLNCLTTAQVNNLGLAGTTISQTAGQYYASAPNRACVGANANRLLAYSDWAGLRPMSYLEFEKAYNGPRPPRCENQNYFDGCAWYNYGAIPDVSANFYWGSGVYGSKSLMGILSEPYVRISGLNFNRIDHGNGVLLSSGLTDIPAWNSLPLNWGDGCYSWYIDECNYGNGFRLCRTAE